MNVVGYYVTKGGVPCAFQNDIGSYRAGLLVPVTHLLALDPSKVPAAAFFNKRRDAARAMNRSRTAAQSMRTAAPWVEEAARKLAPSYFDPSPFAIWPLAKQLAGLPKPKDQADAMGTPVAAKTKRMKS